MLEKHYSEYYSKVRSIFIYCGRLSSLTSSGLVDTHTHTYLSSGLISQIGQDLHGNSVGLHLQTAAVQPVSELRCLLSYTQTHTHNIYQRLS